MKWKKAATLLIYSGTKKYIVLAPALSLKRGLRNLPPGHISGKQTGKLCQLWLFWLRRGGPTQFFFVKWLICRAWIQCSYPVLSDCAVFWTSSSPCCMHVRDVAGTASYQAGLPYAKYLADQQPLRSLLSSFPEKINDTCKLSLRYSSLHLQKLYTAPFCRALQEQAVADTQLPGSQFTRLVLASYKFHDFHSFQTFPAPLPPSVR